MEDQRKHNHDEIVALFDQGLEIQDIAHRVGCSEGLVSMVTHQHGRSAFLRRYPESEKWDRDGILEDYQSGVYIKEIFAKHNISPTHFYRLRKKSGIPLRPRPSMAGKKNGQYKHGLGGRQHERNRTLVQQVAALCLGHVVPEGWIIHHIDGEPSNNCPENLAVFPSRSAHGRCHQQLLRLQREGLEVNATQLVLENDGWLLPLPDRPILLPHEKGRLDPRKKKMKPKPGQTEC